MNTEPDDFHRKDVDFWHLAKGEKPIGEKEASP